MNRRTKFFAAVILAAAAALAPKVEAASFDTVFYPLKQVEANLPTCNARWKGTQRIILDGVTSSDCTTGGGSAVAECTCNGSAWIAQTTGGDVTTALATAALLAGRATGQTILGDSTANDTSALALRSSSGVLDSTALSLGQDDWGFAVLAGGDEMSTFGYTQSTTTLGGSATNVLFSGTDVTLDSGATTLTLTAGALTVTKLAIPSAGTLPTCDATLAPAGFVALAYDTTGNDVCVCNGSAWATVDGSGTCA